MSKSHKVRVTKTRQQHAGEPVLKAGKPRKGANFVAPKAESAKKAAQKTAAARKKSK
jgi:hypothetical protein